MLLLLVNCFLDGSNDKLVPYENKTPPLLGGGVCHLDTRRGVSRQSDNIQVEGGADVTLGLVRVVPVAFSRASLGGEEFLLNLTKLGDYNILIFLECPTQI